MKKITPENLENYKKYLYNQEKAEHTIEKYMRDLEKFVTYANGREVSRELLISYKNYLLNETQYKVSSINSFLVAANVFLEYMGWYEAKVKTLKIQSETFCQEEKELTKAEYKKLVNTAIENGNYRLSVIIQTICATGIRVSELSSITINSIRKGVIVINNKGKIRKVLIAEKLRKILLMYTIREKIKSGIVFCTKSGKAINRSNIWRDMKALCKKANISESKVFPHNLRHLFARTYYAIKKDLAGLADILGHSNIETTRIYIKKSSREHKKQLDQMDLVLQI